MKRWSTSTDRLLLDLLLLLSHGILYPLVTTCSLRKFWMTLLIGIMISMTGGRTSRGGYVVFTAHLRLQGSPYLVTPTMCLSMKMISLRQICAHMDWLSWFLGRTFFSFPPFFRGGLTGLFCNRSWNRSLLVPILASLCMGFTMETAFVIDWCDVPMASLSRSTMNPPPSPKWVVS